jgi:hypothetical protein
LEASSIQRGSWQLKKYELKPAVKVGVRLSLACKDVIQEAEVRRHLKTATKQRGRGHCVIVTCDVYSRVVL